MKMKRIVKISIIFFLMISICFSLFAQADSSEEFSKSFADAIAGICAGTLCFIGGVLYFFISLIIAYWMLKDADKRGKNGGVWLLVGLILGIIGLIIWFIIRPKTYKEKIKKEEDRICPGCGRNIPLDANICPYCKRDFSPK